MMKERLRELAEILDSVVGDTEPDIDPDWTDEEIQDEEPLFYVCRELFKMADES